MIAAPNLVLEQAAREVWDVLLVAGLDEAGRGAIAGPVVAAAVILPFADCEEKLAGVRDSKQLTMRQREALYPQITAHALAYGIGSSSANEIDELAIIGANRLAMSRALSQLHPQPQCLLLDGRMRLPDCNLPQQSIIRGDSKSLSIAAASILAKVTRDRLMVALEAHYPNYAFARHKGYCTAAHVAALERHGPCPVHRRTFAPVR